MAGADVVGKPFAGAIGMSTGIEISAAVVGNVATLATGADSELGSIAAGSLVEVDGTGGSGGMSIVELVEGIGMFCSIERSFRFVRPGSPSSSESSISLSADILRSCCRSANQLSR